MASLSLPFLCVTVVWSEKRGRGKLATITIVFPCANVMFRPIGVNNAFLSMFVNSTAVTKIEVLTVAAKFFGHGILLVAMRHMAW